MQLTIQASGDNVQAISYLLSKNPRNLYERNHKGHLVRLFYSKFTETELEATIFVTPDPIELVKGNSNSYDITHYINDREFAVSSIFCSLIRSALGTALNGQPKEEHTEWVNHPFSFQFEFGPVVSSLSDNQLKDLFEPIGYEVMITRPEITHDLRQLLAEAVPSAVESSSSSAGAGTGRPQSPRRPAPAPVRTARGRRPGWPRRRRAAGRASAAMPPGRPPGGRAPQRWPVLRPPPTSPAPAVVWRRA